MHRCDEGLGVTCQPTVITVALATQKQMWSGQWTTEITQSYAPSVGTLVPDRSKQHQCISKVQASTRQVDSMSEKHSVAAILIHYGLENVPDRLGWQKVKCPFHGDTHASASVNIQENAFKCFACEMAGDTYKLIMMKEGVDFREAYALAETIAGSSDSQVQPNSRFGRTVSNKSRTNGNRRGYTPPRGRRASASRT